MLILLSLVQPSVDMYIKAFTVLYFSRETRKADTNEKHFELVETLFHFQTIYANANLRLV